MDILGDITEVQPEKLRVRGNPRKGIISVRTGFFASRDAESCVPEIPELTGNAFEVVLSKLSSSSDKIHCPLSTSDESELSEIP